MKYEEPQDSDVDSIVDETLNRNLVRKPEYVSDNTAFMRWSTELEQIPEVIDVDFLRNNRHRIIDLDKFLPLSNIRSGKMIKLSRLRRMNLGLAKDAGLWDVADETTLDNLADYQMSRGIEGFYQNALITQKREWLDKSSSDKKMGFLRRLFSRAEEKEKEQMAIE